MSDTAKVASAWSEECERSSMNKIIEDAISDYEVEVWASFTKGIMFRQPITIGVRKVAWISIDKNGFKNFAAGAGYI